MRMIENGYWSILGKFPHENVQINEKNLTINKKKNWQWSSLQALQVKNNLGFDSSHKGCLFNYFRPKFFEIQTTPKFFDIRFFQLNCEKN